MKLDRVEVHRVKTKLRTRLWHAGATRDEVESIFVRAFSVAGAIGCGETIAREYLTGETPESVHQDLAKLIAELAHEDLSREAWLDTLRTLSAAADAERRTAAFCALEIALLDLLARDESVPLGALFEITLAHHFKVALPVLDADLHGAKRADVMRRAGGFEIVKVKVGGESDLERVRIFTDVGVPTWVDANGHWRSLAEATQALAPFVSAGVVGIEQPIHATAVIANPTSLKMLERDLGVPISADESLCTQADALRLAGAGSCSIWNLRLAKNGGLINTLAISAIAKRAGIDIQIGALVGESSVLAAAGLWLASAHPNRRLFEGCYGTRILTHDVGRPSLVAEGTIAARLDAAGHGVSLALSESESKPSFVWTRDTSRTNMIP